MDPQESTIDPSDLLPESDTTLATGIPENKIPDYSVDGFNYVSTQGGVKNWKLEANQAHLYTEEKITHARVVKTFIYGTDGKITVVTSREAKYFTNDRDLEMFGNVKATMPDGFVIESEFLRYEANRARLNVPTTYAVHGYGKTGNPAAAPSLTPTSPASPPPNEIDFQSKGMNYDMKNGVIQLPAMVKVTALSPAKEKTVIESDRCTVLRNEQSALFRMYPNRPIPKRFVYITQPSQLTRGRSADFFYGTQTEKLEYLIVREDVQIQETGNHQSLKYATAGRATFDSRQNTILLSEYPQVYQDHDTVTGDVIILHRDTDIVEVEHSNAFSQGSRGQ